MVCQECYQLSLEQVNCCGVMVFILRDGSERDAVELVVINISVIAEELINERVIVISVTLQE